MTKILTSQASLGNVIKHEYPPETGYCRTTGIYTKTADTKVGMVVTLTTGKWTDFADLNSTDAIGIMIDETVYDASNGDVAGTAILNGSPAIVRLGGLSVATGATLSLAVTALEAAGIKVADKFSTDEL